MDALSPRELKALEIAAKSKLQRSGDRWFVPSQTRGKGGDYYYTVKPDPLQPHCNCPDFEARKLRCKHIFAVEYTIQREQTSDGQTTITETLKISRKTYPQDWPAYNKAQTEEKGIFQRLLHHLCEGIGEPSQVMGRPRLSLPDMIFSAAFKVYSTVSARRFVCDLREAHAKGYISKLPCYNSIFRYFEDEILTPHLEILIEESSLPLQTRESSFAVDSSGFSISKFVQWVQAKHHNPKLLEARDWVKVHLWRENECSHRCSDYRSFRRRLSAIQATGRSNRTKLHYGRSVGRQSVFIRRQSPDCPGPQRHAVYPIQGEQRSREEKP